MKAKAILLVTAMATVMLLVAPAQVNAEGAAMAENSVAVATLGDTCHCGGIRQQTVVKDYASVPCPTHGATCGNYFWVTLKIYHYCSNPYCTDTWYTEGSDSGYYEHH